MMSAKKRIALIGFMGTGKTTVGKALSDATGRDFIDTDSLIEKRAGKSIPRIFSEDGEKSFRELESKVVREVCGLESVIISFGGGVLLDPSNASEIAENTTVVLLRSSVDTVISRTSSHNTRPLLDATTQPLEERVKALLVDREMLYTDAMDLAVDTDSMSVGEVVAEIIRRLNL